MLSYANIHGKQEGKPYFSMDGVQSITDNQWNRLRSKFIFEYGVMNVWSCPSLRSKERLKNGSLISHPNQKPLELMDRIILASSDRGDIIWEPFGGTASATISAIHNGRYSYVCELDSVVAKMAQDRINYKL